MAQPPADPVQSALLVAAGVTLMAVPGRIRRRAERIHAERLEQLDAGVEERFFEERRSLESYRPPRLDRTWRWLGAALILVAALQILLAV